MASVIFWSALAAPFAAIGLATILYLRHRKRKTGEGRRSIVLFGLGGAGVGAGLAYLAFQYLPWALCEGLAVPLQLSGAWCGISVYIAIPVGFTTGLLGFSGFWSLHGAAP